MAELYHIGELIWNLQRAIRLMEGHCGKIDNTLSEYHFTAPLASGSDNPDFIVLGDNDTAVNRKGAVVDREKFARMEKSITN